MDVRDGRPIAKSIYSLFSSSVFCPSLLRLYDYITFLYGPSTENSSVLSWRSPVCFTHIYTRVEQIDYVALPYLVFLPFGETIHESLVNLTNSTCRCSF